MLSSLQQLQQQVTDVMQNSIVSKNRFNVATVQTATVSVQTTAV
jgi:hypothetical protein